MRSNIPKPLAEHLDRLGLALPDVEQRASSWVSKWGRDLPPFEALWIDALHRTGAVSAFQATMLQRGQGGALRVGPYVLVGERPRLNGRPTFLARRIDQPGDYELIVIECRDSRQAERLAESAAALAETGRCWQREHAWPTADRAAPAIDAGADDCRFYAAMPYIEGRSLAELTAGRGKFDAGLASVVARPLLLVLAELDEAGLGGRIVTRDHVRLTRHGGLVVVAPGLFDVLLSVEEEKKEESVRQAPVDPTGETPRSDGPYSGERAMPFGTPGVHAAACRRACGALLQQLACGAVGSVMAGGDLSLPSLSPELSAVITELVSPSGDATLRQLADRLPRNDDAARRLAADRAYRPIAIQRQWLRSSERFDRGPFDRRRMMQPLLWLALVGGLLGGGWWAASLRSSVSARTSEGAIAAAPISVAEGVPSAGAMPGATAEAAGATDATASVSADLHPDRLPNSHRSAEPRVIPESSEAEGRAGRIGNEVEFNGSRRPNITLAEGRSPTGDVRQSGRPDDESTTAVRQVQFESVRQAGPLVGQPGQSSQSRPADLIIDAQSPIDASRLQLRDDQRVRAAPGCRATIALPDNGWRLSADNVIFEQIDFVVSRASQADQNDKAAMIVLEGRRAEFCGCTFDASGQTAIVWKTTARASEHDLVLGRLLFVDCVFRDCLSAVRSEGDAAQVVEAANVLHWRGGAFWLIDGAVGGGEPLKLLLRQFTMRESGPLIEFAEEPSAAVSLTVEAEAAVFAPRAGLPVVMLHGRRPDRVLDRLVWSGRGSLLAGNSPFAMLTREADEVVALDDEAAAVAGLTRGRVVFAGAVESGVESQQVAHWQGPSAEEDPPGIAAGRLPTPALRR